MNDSLYMCEKYHRMEKTRYVMKHLIESLILLPLVWILIFLLFGYPIL